MKRYMFAALLAALTVAVVGCTEKEPDSVDTYAVDPVNSVETVSEPSETLMETENAETVPEDIADLEGFRPMPKWEIFGDSMEKQGDAAHPHIYAEFPAIVLADETADAYPSFADGISKLNDTIKSSAAYFVNEFGSIEVEEAAGVNAEWGSTETLEPLRFDTIVASFERYLYSYTGGIHGNGVRWGTTIDIGSGTEIGLADVLTDVMAVALQLDDKLLEAYDEDCFFDAETLEASILGYVKDDECLLNWALTDNGIRFYFNEYELGPYASGCFEVSFTYEELGGLFNAAYLPSVG